MKLVCIYNTWGDVDLLKLSINNIRPLVEGIVVVFSVKSNYGERLQPGEPDGSALELPISNVPIHFVQQEPVPGKNPRENETFKRNVGLEWAKAYGYTHFLSMDADEFYEPEPFLKAKERFHVEPNLQGLVCNCQTYFKSPKLTIGLDTTLVPFIHKLTPHIRHGFNKGYPFAWIDGKIRIDPTRSLNIYDGIMLTTHVTMHHYSWVRKDYQKKIRNSTARSNLERSTILKDLLQAKDGGFCQYYGKPLVRATVDFNIPEYEFDEGSQSALYKDL